MKKQIKHLLLILLLVFLLTACDKKSAENILTSNNRINVNNNLEDGTSDNQSQQEYLGVTTSEVDVNLGDNVDYCSNQLTYADNGGIIYPINIKKYKSDEYGNIGWLGAVFTADDCGISRVKDLFGNDYDSGLKIWVSNNIPESFIYTLKENGFICANDGISDSLCKKWQVEKSISIVNLLKFKPYYKYILLTDCINCG